MFAFPYISPIGCLRHIGAYKGENNYQIEKTLTFLGCCSYRQPVQILVLPLMSWVTLGKSQGLSDHWFPDM